MYEVPPVYNPYNYLGFRAQHFPQVRWRLAIVSQPAVEPVTITEAKALDKIEFNDEDPVWVGWLINARQLIEGDTARAFIRQTWALYLDEFPARDIDLRRCPVQSIESLTYVDNTGAVITLDPSLYSLDFVSEPARVTPAAGHCWPPTRWETPNAVTVTFTAGFGDDPDDVPEFCKSPIKSLAAWWNRNRQSAGLKPPHYESLVAPLKWGDYQ